ncbi:MAG: hypothetical protein ACR5K4_01375 [Sodalis sp. (in: enterobacteria)]
MFMFTLLVIIFLITAGAVIRNADNSNMEKRRIFRLVAAVMRQLINELTRSSTIKKFIANHANIV